MINLFRSFGTSTMLHDAQKICLARSSAWPDRQVDCLSYVMSDVLPEANQLSGKVARRSELFLRALSVDGGTFQRHIKGSYMSWRRSYEPTNTTRGTQSLKAMYAVSSLIRRTWHILTLAKNCTPRTAVRLSGKPRGRSIKS